MSDAMAPVPPTSPPPGAGGPARACVSLPCQSDADCGGGTRCELAPRCTRLLSGLPSCGQGNMCVPAWQAACTADSDCGQGFTCSGSASDAGTCVIPTLVSCNTDADCLPMWPCECADEACEGKMCLPPDLDLSPLDPSLFGSSTKGPPANDAGGGSTPSQSTQRGGCQFVAGDAATPWAVLLGLCFSLVRRGRRRR